MMQNQLKTKPRRILLKLNSKEMKWILAIFMLYYAVLAVFASGDRTSSL